jgi:hypothetical protein
MRFAWALPNQALLASARGFLFGGCAAVDREWHLSDETMEGVETEFNPICSSMRGCLSAGGK